MYMGDKMKNFILLILLLLVFSLTACDTELGHHDHDCEEEGHAEVHDDIYHTEDAEILAHDDLNQK